MGRKVHPIGFRLGINQPWGGRWFAEGSTYRQHLHQDFAIRNLLLGKLSKGGAAANEKTFVNSQTNARCCQRRQGWYLPN
jgi:small subunit ribosomal protein S3